MTILEQLPERSPVAIIRLRSLGDCVLTTPAISLLKKTRPDLQICVAVEPRFAAVFEDNPDVAQIAGPTWQQVRSFRPTLCLNLHGGSRSQWMTALSGAKWRAGFAHHSVTFAYNFKIPRAQRILGVNRTVHTAEHLASAIFALGAPIQPIPRASLFSVDQGKTRTAGETACPTRYAVVHPFASAADKTWPADRFCEVARYLQLSNITPVFLAGPEDNVLTFAAHRVVQGSLRDAKAVLSKAAVFIGNDSGPAHMAAAFGVPSVVLFGNSNPAIWGPWQTESQVIAGLDGLDKVSVSRVIAALERLRVLEEAHA